MSHLARSALAVAVLALPGAAEPFSVAWYSIDGGGGLSSGGPFSLAGTTGQPDVGGPLFGGSFSVRGGFWEGLAANAACPCAADYNNDGGIDGSDIASFFADWEAGSGCADVNQDGGIDGADMEVFFGLWEAGGC